MLVIAMAVLAALLWDRPLVAAMPAVALGLLLVMALSPRPLRARLSPLLFLVGALAIAVVVAQFGALLPKL